jgi:carbon storage regulator
MTRRSFMLTLTRKSGEVIVITLEDGRQIEVVVKEIRRNQVRLGIEAPRSCMIHREEQLAEEPAPLEPVQVEELDEQEELPYEPCRVLSRGRR